MSAYTPTPQEDRPLTTNEAKLVADWLEAKTGTKIPRGYVAVFRLRPSVIASKYQVSPLDILVACRRKE